MSVFNLLIMLCFIDKGTSLKGRNVCFDTDRTKEYCCWGYEDINGTCKECKIGFESVNGKPCSHCQTKRYGERCLSRCYCNEIEERCDHVKGCVPKFELSGTSLKGRNVCVDKDRTKEYCCSGYEDINGTCKECKIGFVSSVNGKPCSQCQTKRFGKRCLGVCRCNEIEERCDHVKGCVPKFELSEFSSSNNTAIVYVLCAGSLVVIIGLSVYFRQHCCQKSTISERITSHRNDSDGFPMQILDQHILIDDNSVYDYPFN